MYSYFSEDTGDGRIRRAARAADGMFGGRSSVQQTQGASEW